MISFMRTPAYNHCMVSREDTVPGKIAQMSPDELRDLIGAIVEQKLVELFGDPDEGLVLNETLRQRLLDQKKAVSDGERGELFEEIVTRHGLA